MFVVFNDFSIIVWTNPLKNNDAEYQENRFDKLLRHRDVNQIAQSFLHLH